MAETNVLKQTMKVVPIASLVAHPENARIGNVQRIKDSIRRNGFYGAVVVQTATNRILVGNHRVAAARELGIEKIPVALLDVDDATARRILVADNKTSDEAEWDDAALKKILETVIDGAPDRLTAAESLGFSDDDLRDALAMTPTPLPSPADFDLKTKPRAAWMLVSGDESVVARMEAAVRLIANEGTKIEVTVSKDG